LQHPHILPLFDSGEADTYLFYVMPYVEGETLRDRLDREHQLPVDDAVQIAKNVAEALDYAHRQGVIHRDIKPANILLQAGKPVISDFGIALAVGVAGGGRMTETGLSLGTPHYMSPEQATGDMSVGAATDVYALGCVLYEMLVGEPPFTGSTPQAVLGKIVTGDAPSASAERRSVPPNVDAAIRRALEKVPADRFPNAASFAASLADPTFDTAAHAASAPGPARAATRWMVVSGLSVLAAAITLTIHLTEIRPTPHALHYTMTLPSEGDSEGLFFQFRVSPDGRYVAVSGVIETQGGIFVRELESLEWRYLPGTLTSDFFWSPDSRTIAFFEDQRLSTVSVEGGPVQELARLGAGDFFWANGSWGRDDVILMAPPGGGPLMSLPASGGEPVALTSAASDEMHRYPTFLPGSQHFLYTIVGGANAGIYVGSLTDPGGRRLLPDVSSAIFAPTSDGPTDGHLLFSREGRLVAQGFDLRARELSGDPFELSERAFLADNGKVATSASDNGIVIYLDGRNRKTDSRLVWVDRSGTVLGTEGFPGPESPVSLSPGDRVAAVLRQPFVARFGDIWMLDLARGIENPFTFDRAVHAFGNIVWSSDGSRIVFPRVDAGGGTEISVRDVLGSDEGVVITPTGNFMNPTSWSPDGYLLYTDVDAETGADIWYVRTDGTDAAETEPVPFRRDQFYTSFGQVSPGGEWIAYVSDETGTFEVWVEPFPSGTGRWRITETEAARGTGTTQQPRWSPDGSELFYVAGAVGRGTIMAAPVTVPRPGESPVLDAQPLFDIRYNSYAPMWGTHFYDVSEDGQRFLISAVEDSTDPVIHVRVNWGALN
jgi:Tol biopolymer transport system component